MLHVVHSIIFQKPTEPPAENQMTYQYEILSAMCKIIKCVISHLLIDSIKHFTWKIPYRRLLATGNIIFPSCIWGIKCITLFTLSTFFTSSNYLLWRYPLKICRIQVWCLSLLLLWPFSLLPILSYQNTGFVSHFLNFSTFFSFCFVIIMQFGCKHLLLDLGFVCLFCLFGFFSNYVGTCSTRGQNYELNKILSCYVFCLCLGR